METSSLFNFVANDIFSLKPIPDDSIQKIISSHFLHLKSEDQLLEFLKGLIQENPHCMNFLEYLHFGVIDFPNFIDYINPIQFHELNLYLFDHMKYSFFYNYLLLADQNSSQKEIQHLLFLSESVSSYSQICKENQDLNILKSSYSTSFDHFEISPPEHNQVWFTKEQQNTIGKYSFIHLFSGTIRSFQEMNFWIENHLLIFISNSIQSIPKDCFRNYSSLLPLQNGYQ
jgi:hypothetical protein